MANQEAIRRLADRGQHLSTLKGHPSYPAFKAIVEKQIENITKKFISTAVVSQQELDYGRGLMNGLQWSIDVIERGEKEFQRAMQLARLEEEQ